MTTHNTIGILVIGNEVLDGRVADTNSHRLIQRLSQAGFETAHVLSCVDEETAICGALGFLSERVGFIVCSGGLGPTSDDLTRQAAARFAGVPLVLDPHAQEQMVRLYQRRGRVLDEVNLRQAYLPQGAEVLANPVGTAPGFALAIPGGATLASLPGVPGELERMCDEALLPLLERRLGRPAAPHTAYFRVFGKPESQIGRLVEGCALPPGIQVSYRASFPEVQLRLRSRDVELSAWAHAVRQAIGADAIFSEDPELDLPGCLHELLIARRHTLALAESCTGGLAGALLTRLPGASAYLRGGVVSYANAVKEELLEVPAQILEQEGAVSRACAAAMAEGVRRRLHSDFALSITGIAGPDGGTAEKPVGTFFVGLSTGTEPARAFHYFLPLERNRIRLFAAYAAFDLLRRVLLDLPLENYAVR